MKKLNWLILIVTLVACSPNGNVTPTVVPIPSSMPMVPTATSTVTPIPTSTQQTVLKEQCVEMLPAIPKDNAPLGILVVGRTLMNFRQQEQRVIPGGLGVGVSPNGKWFAYVVSIDVGDDYHSTLYVESVDGQTQRQLPLDDNWIISGNTLQWLDNERLVFPVIDKKKPRPTLVLNPFTGEQQVLLANYPNFALFGDPSMPPPLYFGENNVVYNPSLQLVAYPQDTDDGEYIALWDRESGQTVAKVLSKRFYMPAPLWLPSGNTFVAAAFPDKDHPREWFMVSNNGEIVQLTHFGNMYSQHEFGSYASLSPDGHYLAFGLDIDHQLSDNRPSVLTELVILNLQTLEAVNTCVRSDSSTIIWSPDSQYLAVLYWGHGNLQSSSFVVVNFKQRWAVNMSTSDDGLAIPRGWLDSGTK